MGPKDLLTEEYLKKEYVENKKSVHTIAKELGLKSSNSITQYLKKFGLYRESVFKDPKIILTYDVLYDFYINRKMSLKNIAEYANTTKKRVSQILREYKILIRDTWDLTENQYKFALNRRLKGGNILIPGQVLSRIKSNAIERGWDFNLTPEYLWELFLSQGEKCALSKVPIKFHMPDEKRSATNASLDRIDSSKGYVEGNVQWVHKRVNFMKAEISNKELIAWCKLISENNDLQKNAMDIIELNVCLKRRTE